METLDEKNKKPVRIPNRTRAVKKIRIDANGRKTTVFKCMFPGYELESPGSRTCMRSSMSQIRKRALASRKRVRKIRGKMGMIARSRSRAMARRKAKGL
jgi:hypothetical protein